MAVALSGVSLPIFFTGILTLVIFSYQLGWTAPGGSYTPIEENPAEWAYNLILPWVTLAFLFAAIYARLTRAGMLETMGEDYIRTARAKGLSERRVIMKHGLRGALTPIVTIFGLDVSLLMGGAVLTESTFSLPGLGKYAIDAITTNDLPKVMGVTTLTAIFVVLANLVVDLLYAVVDPRVRLG
jgi:peptide/nickel transport system permease protein